MLITDIVIKALIFLAFAGCLYMVLTWVAAGRIMRRALIPATPLLPVTILKPLHGAEPGLIDNLASFLDQDYPGAVRMICGVASADDPAIAIVEALRARFPDHEIKLVVDPAQHGRNRKVSNLINIDRSLARPAQADEIILLADSDIRVQPGYLATVVAALGSAGIGAVSCLYRGLPASGFAPRLSALGIDAHFLPNAALGIAFGLAEPCFGSTIALRRATLARIGGFFALKDQLADDYELGAAVRRLGLKVAFPPIIVDHVCVDSTFGQLWRHDLRWARTIRTVNPAGHLGSIVTHPVGFALLAGVLSGFSRLALAALALTLLARLIAFRLISRRLALYPAPFWLLPIRDLLSYSVLIRSFFGRKVDWQGHHYDVAPDGAMSEPVVDASADAARATLKM